MAHTDTSPESLARHSSSLFRSISLLVRNSLELVQLESKLSLRSLALAFGLLFFSSMLLLAGWISLLIGAAFILHEYGLSWPENCMIILFLNIALFSICLGFLRYHLNNIGFSNTIELLKKQSKTGWGQYVS